MHHTSVVHSLLEKGGTGSGGVEGLRTDDVNGRRDFPPHPGPLPLGGGEGECFADLGGLILILSSILRIHQYTGDWRSAEKPQIRENPNKKLVPRLGLEPRTN